MEQYFSRRNIIIGTILTILVSYLGYSFFKKNNLSPLSKDNDYSKKIVSDLNTSLIKENSDFISNFSKEIKKATKNIYKLNKRSSETPEQLAITNNLFRKEINIKRLIIDSKEIHKLHNYNTSNYTINLLNKNGLNKGTIGSGKFGYRICSSPPVAIYTMAFKSS